MIKKIQIKLRFKIRKNAPSVINFKDYDCDPEMNNNNKGTVYWK